MKVRAGPDRRPSASRRSRRRLQSRRRPSAATAASGPRPGTAIGQVSERRGRAAGRVLATITPAAIAERLASAEAVLDDEAADRVAEARQDDREHRRAAPRPSRRGRRRAGRRRRRCPSPTPTRRSPVERSSWSTQIASSAVNSGAEETRMPGERGGDLLLAERRSARTARRPGWRRAGPGAGSRSRRPRKAPRGRRAARARTRGERDPQPRRPSPARGRAGRS